MYGNRKFTFLSILLVISLAGQGQIQKIYFNQNWKAKKAAEVMMDGNRLTFPDVKLYNWMDAIVPGTVLTTLLHNRKIPDPGFGMNNEQIPDIYDVGKEFYTYWFYNQFKTPETTLKNPCFRLKFRGINYTANIFLNGKRINSKPHQGMYLREEHDITSLLRKDSMNSLAVLVDPPDPVGNPNGGQGGDGQIGKSVTNQFAAGWDWIQPVRDRNTGIWDKVTLEITGPVIIHDPFVKTIVPGKRFPGVKQDPAQLQAYVTLENTSGIIQSGFLQMQVEGRKTSVSFSLNPHSLKEILLPVLKLNHPKLWWPNGTGAQNLYMVKMGANLNREILSDQRVFKIGIRQYDSYFDKDLGARVFLVNGQKIFITGGNWITTDAMLRLSKKRYEAEVRLHAEMHMNMIRVWGGALIERPEFYEACDRYGIMVWQDLPVTGDCNGRWHDPKKKDSQARRKEYPDNHELFIHTVEDQIKLLRNHPSLCIWCGGNEKAPPEDINNRIRNELMPRYDGTRLYLDESTSDSLLKNTIGGNGDGPYSIQDPVRLFTFRNYPFNPETGSVGLPNIETMQSIMNEADLKLPVNHWVPPVFRYHKYQGYGNRLDLYGKPENIEDFCFKAQMVNYNQYRALIEGYNAHAWDWYSGILIWKTQNPWTALRGMMYDFRLDQTGAFYGVKKATEPLHVQFNLDDSTVCMVNRGFEDFRNGEVRAEVYNSEGKILSSRSEKINCPASSVQRAFKFGLKDLPDPGCFLRLNLEDFGKNTISRNLYWLQQDDGTYSDLHTLKETELQVDRLGTNSNGSQVRLRITNTGPGPAFFIRLKMVHKQTGSQILPAYYSENYFTLIPGEYLDVKLDVPGVSLSDINMEIQGWNVSQGLIILSDL